MQIVITTWLSLPCHSMPIVSTQKMWACELSIMGSGSGPASPGGRSCSVPAKREFTQRSVSRNATFFVCSEQVIVRCTGKYRENEKKGVSHNPKCFCPVWAKVLADDRPFCSQKESDSSNKRDRDTRVNHSFIQSINQPGPFIWSSVHSSTRPVGQGLIIDATDRESDFQHSPNIERSPCSNHREPVPWSARPACVSSSPDTAHQMGQRQCPRLRLYALVPWPLSRP